MVAQQEKSGDHQSHYLGTLENYKKIHGNSSNSFFSYFTNRHSHP